MSPSPRFEHTVKGPRSPKTPKTHTRNQSHSRFSPGPPSAWRQPDFIYSMPRAQSTPHLHEICNVPDVHVPRPSTSQINHVSQGSPMTPALEFLPHDDLSTGKTSYRRNVRPLPPVPPSSPSTSSDCGTLSAWTRSSHDTSASSSPTDAIRPLPKLVTSFTAPVAYSPPDSPPNLPSKRVFRSETGPPEFGGGIKPERPVSPSIPLSPLSIVNSIPDLSTSPSLKFAQLPSPVSGATPRFPISPFETSTRTDFEFLSGDPLLPFRGIPYKTMGQRDSPGLFNLRTSTSSPSLKQDRSPSKKKSVVASKELKIVAIEGRIQGEEDIRTVIPKLRQLKASKKRW